mmetsp:Transcript_9773/g.13819  ORF Transcript_9773/g.13819 Transcript_9773/m.13819 type:complete len:107 (+) Transcript_9773:33-353(+)
MMTIRLIPTFFICATIAVGTNAFQLAPSFRISGGRNLENNAQFIKAKKNDYDFSSIESRDMTKEEMLEMNKQNEDIMNMELQMMTGFSLVISLPILYLCWVAFYSE